MAQVRDFDDGDDDADDRGTMSRAPQGGKVPGTTKSAATLGAGIDVARASFEANYDLDTTFQGGDPSNKMTQADLIRGYVASGRLVGGRGR